MSWSRRWAGRSCWEGFTVTWQLWSLNGKEVLGEFWGKAVELPDLSFKETALASLWGMDWRGMRRESGKPGSGNNLTVIQETSGGAYIKAKMIEMIRRWTWKVFRVSFELINKSWPKLMVVHVRLGTKMGRGKILDFKSTKINNMRSCV